MPKSLNADPTQKIEVVLPVATQFFEHENMTVVVELYPFPTYHLTVTRQTPEHGLASHQIQLSEGSYQQILEEMSEEETAN